MDRIRKAGYQTVTPVIVTNSDEYKSVQVVKTGSVQAGDEVLTVC